MVTLVHEKSKVVGEVESLTDDLGVTLVNLGFFYLQPVPNLPEITVWEVEASLAERMAEIMDGMDHLREGADGFRKRLLGDGWSETMSEQLAGAMLAQMIGAAFQQGQSS
jgi:hypothetical protein